MNKEKKYQYIHINNLKHRTTLENLILLLGQSNTLTNAEYLAYGQISYPSVSTN